MVKEAIDLFERDWMDPIRRTAICSGKKTFAALNGQLQQNFGLSITSNQVIRYLEPSDADDLLKVLGDLDQFAKTEPLLLTSAA